ncbi:MAG: glucoamylase family protein, partial [Gammaproteobacteria bacterium]
MADRLARNHQALRAAYGVINDAARANRSITPAAQWLLDNFHLVLEQAADLPDQLNPALLRKLPRVLAPDNGALLTEIRIFSVLRAFVSHVDSRFEPNVLQAFLMAYQSVTPLTMAELWAIPGAFRFILVDNLRRVAEMTARAMAARSLADEYADRLLAHMEARGSNTTTGPPPPLVLPEVPLQLPFPVQLIERLRHRGDDARAVLGELAAALELKGITLDEAVRWEHNRQSANNATACNIITGLREIGAVDWRSAFESLSFVEHLLANLPSYAAADHRTRDRYRNEIAQLAEQSDASEVLIAMALRDITGRADPGPPLGNDVGYHLVDAGRPEFESLLGATPGVADRIRRRLSRHGIGFYVTAVALVTAVLSAVCLTAGLAGQPGLPPPPLFTWLALGLLALFPASDVAIRLLGWGLIRGYPARSLSRLALATGLPRTARTLVVVPIMLTSARDIDAAVEQLEVHALANADPQLQLALLSDWPDSDREICPGEAELVQRGRDLIAQLNSRYSRGETGEPQFHLFHRHRVWSDGEGCWMGWERKRGKLAELNRLLLGDTDTSFIPDLEGLPVPTDIRYVLTLDADTRLPMGSVRKLVGTALHPLNQPRWDPSGEFLVRGFGVLQPRITPLLAEDAERSAFLWVTAGSSGMDPYAGAISDVYQDFLGTGIYTGKGLYDLQTFEQALRDRVPENAVLSHDLLEGLFARCGLVTDVEFYEEFPSHSEVAAARAHRWMRGDWQLLPWLVGRRRRETSLLGKWQIFDNLRRSLLAPAAVALLVATWCTSAANQSLWVVLVLAPLLVPVVLDTLAQLVSRTSGVTLPARVHGAFRDLLGELGRAFVFVALLAQNAWLTIDAVARSLFRLLSKRRLLEWITAAQVKAATNHALPMFVWPLKSSAIVVIAGTAALVWANPDRLWAAAPWLFLWWLTPVVARGLSLPWFLRADFRNVSPGNAAELRAVARSTWRFFTTFVTAAEQHLPPDNFQEHPAPVIAHRTSPTNIGLYLLAVGTARDFGWLGLSDAAGRWTATLGTLDRLELLRGHFYNWYDTRTLAPLSPRYVSTVDSGNLAGHLIAVKQYCIESLKGPALDTARLHGLRDTASAVLAALTDLRDAPRLGDIATAVQDDLENLPLEPIAAFARLVNWQALAAELATLAAGMATDRGEPDAAYLYWANALAEDAGSHLRDWQALLPRGLAELPPEAREHVDRVAARLGLFGTLADYPGRCLVAAAELDLLPELAAIATAFRSAGRAAATLSGALDAISQRADALANGMQFDFLFDGRRGLFSIGYRVEDGKLDPSYYDLLASEARLASLMAIAKRDVPVRHWFRLGRPLAGPAHRPVLLSWSGSMFEYLMPSLVMRNPRGSLLAGTCHRAILRHVAYGKARRVPWGISEAAYNLRDQQLTYQYSAFGVPGLGLKRGLARDLVVSPYASALAVMDEAPAVVRNFAALRACQAYGQFGFYESVDFTADRLPPASTHAVVRAYMAHHQAMSLVAFGNALNSGGMQRRFHRETMIQAADLLLHERAPRHPRTADPLPDSREPVQTVAPGGGIYRHFEGVRTGPPVAHLLSNGRYAVMLTVNGAGYSVCQDRAVTRWRDDPTCERHGTFFYLRDIDSGEFWSAGLEPCEKIPTNYEVCFDEDSARISRIDGTLKTVLEVIVSPEEDAELRRLTISNLGKDPRLVDVTSYAEIVLAPQAADVAHPAFSNLFVLTEYDPASRALMATRRPQSAAEPALWAAHVVAVGGGSSDRLDYETDRGRFIGRNANVRAPVAIVDGHPLSNTAGAVLDPVFGLRVRVAIPAGGAVQLTFSTLLAQSRPEALRRAELLTNPMAFERVAMLAWTYARAGLHHLAITETEARLFQSLVTHLLFANAEFRADPQTLLQSRLSISGLWRFGISGDRPCILLRCSEPDHLQLAEQLVRAQAF